MSLNKVMLIGNTGKVPEVNHLQDNVSVAKFSLATTEKYKNKSGELIEDTEWHNIVCWRGLATVCEKYVKKGSKLFIEGRIKTRSYEDKEGNKKYITEIIADNIELLDKKEFSNHTDSQPSEKEAASVSSPKAEVVPQNTNSPTNNYAGDDLPF